MGHKQACKFFSALCKEAAEIAGTPKAWPDLADWVRFHHSTLMNATLACCLKLKPTEGNVSGTRFLLVEVLYRNDPAVPLERKFELLASVFMENDDPHFSRLYEYLAASRENAVFCAKRECGTSYWGTGAYMVLAHFRDPADPNGIVPYFKHFAIDTYHANATRACRPPLHQLTENLEGGKKMRFCCSGRPQGADECCCGGWTHEKVWLPQSTPHD